MILEIRRQAVELLGPSIIQTKSKLNCDESCLRDRLYASDDVFARRDRLFIHLYYLWPPILPLSINPRMIIESPQRLRRKKQILFLVSFLPFFPAAFARCKTCATRYLRLSRIRIAIDIAEATLLQVLTRYCGKLVAKYCTIARLNLSRRLSATTLVTWPSAIMFLSINKYGVVFSHSLRRSLISAVI